MTPETVVIPAGLNVCAELLDRPLAEQVRDGVDRRGDVRAGRRGIVVTDVWWWRDESLQRQPTIAVGGPSLNTVTKEIATTLEWPGGFSKVRVPVLHRGVVVVEPDRVAIWEESAAGIAACVRGFLDAQLTDFLRRVWRSGPIRMV